MNKVVEIRSYNLKPGSRGEFHRLVVEVSLPMLRRWGVDVVAFGPSPHDDNSYYLVRAYDSLEHRQSSQDAFYGSPEWRQGPRVAKMKWIMRWRVPPLHRTCAFVRQPLSRLPGGSRRRD